MRGLLRFSLTALFFTISICVTSQNDKLLSKEIMNKVDSLFINWQKPNTAGVSFVILKDGDVLIKKSYGNSDVENNTKISSKTYFNLAQTSNQFTVYAILKLVNEGKLSLDDDVRKYIDALSHFNDKISVENLLYHSSGIYEHDILKYICGWQYGNRFTKTDVFNLVSRQKDLVFKPGTNFSQADTNFILLAEVISKVTGQSYASYMKSQVFEPLGMSDTFVWANNEEYPIQEIAKPYRTTDKTIPNLTSNVYNGINAIFSNIDDLVIWEKHLVEDSFGKSISELMNEPAKLSNGKTYHTSLGELTVGQYYAHKERGLQSDYIIGELGGHTSSVFKFPEHNYIAIALSNNGEEYNGFYGVISAHHILKEYFLEPETTDFGTLKTISIPNNELKKFEGHYWDQLGELSRELRVKNDTLRYIRSNGSESALIPLKKNKFQMKVEFDDKIYLIFPEKESNEMIYQHETSEPILFEKYIPKKLDKNKLELYNGRYLNKEYNIVFEINADNSKLIFENTKSGKAEYNYIKDNLFLGNYWYMQSVEFSTTGENEINGFVIKNDAIRNLFFEKLKR